MLPHFLAKVDVKAEKQAVSWQAKKLGWAFLLIVAPLGST